MHVMFDITPVREGVCVCRCSSTRTLMSYWEWQRRAYSDPPLILLILRLQTSRWRRPGCLALSALSALSAHTSRRDEKSITAV